MLASMRTLQAPCLPSSVGLVAIAGVCQRVSGSLSKQVAGLGTPSPLTPTYIPWWGLTTVLPCHTTPPTHIFPSGWPRDPITSHPHIYTLVGVDYGPPLPHHSTHSHIPKWLA